MSTPLFVDDRVTLPASSLVWTAVRASGPGGQNVNKVSSKVELRFDLEGCEALAEPVRVRLRAIARNLLDADGWVLITSQKTRDQAKNLADAREKLRLLVVRALEVPKLRRPTKPTRGSQRRRVEGKLLAGAKKLSRRAVRGGDD
jgi:ribosome-associated protein